MALALGTGAGAAVEALAAEPAGVAVPGSPVELGPVTITLPEELGPWSTTSPDAVRELRAGWTGPVELDGVWGRLAPGSVVVTVLTAEAGAHGGVEQFRASVPQDDAVDWTGGREHASGARVSGDDRELVLVTETEAGDLVVLSVSGPEDAFESGQLTQAFRTATVR
ncbi:hypothetical protein N867_12050 [Actinotalea fermentans ATCC 43279 = JCM 9966 = DSM 3133]|nr:hypothetical protein N867_12050 [Actinotalea fermentans ATCC 43279 = JCM 9966 = DSM 3133]